MKVLITGSNGYIGQHLAKLLHTEYEVHGVDLQDENKCEYVVNYQKVNICDPHFLPNSYEAVIHLAALIRVGESVKYPQEYYTANIFGTMNVLNCVTYRNFIFGSTGAAALPTSPYALSKKAAEDIVTQYCTKKNIDFTIFRFYNVIGSEVTEPTNPDGLFCKLKEAVDTGKFSMYGTDYNTKDGTCVRDYVHVNEIANAIKLAIKTPSKSIENLAHGKGYTVKEIVDTFKLVNNVDFDVVSHPRREGDLESSVLENVSSYMENLYSLEDYLTLTKGD